MVLGRNSIVVFILFAASAALAGGEHASLGFRVRPRLPVPFLAAGTDKDKDKGYGGPDYGLPASEIRRLLSLKAVDVPYVPQDGEKCGFYALKMVMAWWNKRDRSKRNPPVLRGEAGDGSEPMWDFALRAKYYWSTKGETTPGDLANVAKAYGYNAKDDRDPAGPDLGDLRKELRAGRPVMVSVRKVENGRPSAGEDFQYGGHWVVVEGFARGNDGREYMIIKHGWSGGSVVWRVDEFEKAWDKNWCATVFVRG